MTDWRLAVTAFASVGAHLAGVAGGYALFRSTSDDGVLVVVLDETAAPERRAPSGAEPDSSTGGIAASRDNRPSPQATGRAPGAAGYRSPAPAWTTPAPAPTPAPRHDVPIAAPSPVPVTPPAVALLEPPRHRTAPVTPSPGDTSPGPAGTGPVAGETRSDVASSPGSPGSAASSSGAPGAGAGASGVGDGVALALPRGEGGGAGEYTEYLTALRARLQQALRYPLSARRRGATGTVQLEILIHADGRIGNVVVIGSSSHPALDDAAVEAVRSLPRQPFPAGLKPRVLRARLPVVFELR